MLFCLIATPCMSTIAATKQESGSWRWALGQFWGLTFLAWALTAVVYQVGSRLFT
jgi:ferrous iron transport protein B